MTTRGSLSTIGYAHPDAAAKLAQLMSKEQSLLVDIRSRPHSRWWPAWKKKALASTYGPRSLWEPRLGNLNYRQQELGIQLAPGHMDAVCCLAHRLDQGTNLILLCVCKEERTCHRSLVAKLIQDEVNMLQEEVGI